MTDRERLAFAELVEVCRRLRAPDGCPWDREQTLSSMTPYLTEEAIESVEAIASGDATHIAEELGDLGFLVIFCLELLREEHGIEPAAALEAASQKLIRRHPHVYGDAVVGDGEAAYRQWQEIKRAEKGAPGHTSLLGDQPKSLPALVAAYRVQEKASAVGFDWPEASGALEKVREEVGEIEQALSKGEPRALAAEIGDVLFATVNLARHLRIDPERELRSSLRRFRDRFEHVERRLAEDGRSPSEASLEEMDALWNEAKALAHRTAAEDGSAKP